MSGIQYPVKTQQISRFERQNPTISVNVIGFENGELFPVYVTKEKKEIFYCSLKVLKTITVLLEI